MSRQTWVESMAWATSDGAALANSTTETILFPNQTVPANYMQDGRGLKIRMIAKYSVTATPTLTFWLRWNGVAGTILCTTGAITCASGVSNSLVIADIDMITRVNGASGSLYANGLVTVGTATVASTQITPMTAGGANAPATASVDLTVDTPLSITAKWSAASASNTITGIQYTITSIN